MSNFFEKIQRLKKPQRIIIAFSIIALLAIIIGWFIVKNLQERIQGLNQNKPLLKEFNLPEFKQGAGNGNNLFKGLEETKRKIEQELEKLEELEAQMDSTSSVTSTE